MYRIHKIKIRYLFRHIYLKSLNSKTPATGPDHPLPTSGRRWSGSVAGREKGVEVDAIGLIVFRW
mgnify:CR=1 FL=1